MASLSSLLCFLSLSSFLFFISPSSSTPITLSLNHFSPTPFPDPSAELSHFASSSLTRAKHLKNPQTKQKISTTPLSPQSYGAYSVSLNFGTPPQTMPFIFDTGSDLVWFPCTQNYLCKNCSSSSTKIPTFFPKVSSSSKLIGCRNPKCSWIHPEDVKNPCKDCAPNSTVCSQICPPYIVIYGSATTGGLLLSETLDLTATKKIPNFAVGCSIFASHSPAGIAGFGRGSLSLPSQLGLKKFSYCLLSHKFDDTTESSSLVLNGGPTIGDKKTTGVSYTPFVKNPVSGRRAFSVYYYVGLRKITVGNKKLKIPYTYLDQGSDGNGGTIVDSGSTFTFMEGRLFDIVASEVEKQTLHYKRASDVESRTGLRPCFDISGSKSLTFPKMIFHFKGGADMELPLANYFSFIGRNSVVCMTIITDGVVGNGLSGGPVVILGNFQFQNFHVEYDLENQRFGFRQQTR